MKTEHMREFIALCESKNYSRTADKFYLTQSALSKHMAAIETELNVKLLDHSNYGFKLTEEGEYVSIQMNRILKMLDDMENHLEEMRSGVRGNLKVGLLYYEAADLGCQFWKNSNLITRMFL